MIEFEGQTRLLGAPEGWRQSGPGAIQCGFLPVQEVELGEHHAFVSYWKPTAEEIARLHRGEAICLTVIGRGHPPVCITVDNVKEKP